MTKQEQVKEILEVIKHCGDYTNRDCAECDYRLYGECKNQKQCEAEALYNAGYRKAQDVGEYKNRFEISDKVLTETRAKLAKAEHDRDRYKAEIERLKAQQREIDRLKAENEELTKVVSSKVYDLIDNAKEIADAREAWEKQAKIDVLNELTVKAVSLSAIETYHICNLVDELLKEYE